MVARDNENVTAREGHYVQECKNMFCRKYNESVAIFAWGRGSC
jgi:hypothetical protein